MSSANRTYVSLQEHGDFLHRLAQDDQLRQELQASPSAVLASFGISIEENSLPNSIDLPAMDTIQSGLEAKSDAKKIKPAVPQWAGIFADLEDLAEN